MTGSIVHFHPNAHFWVGLGLANLSDRTVIVTDVKAVERLTASSTRPGPRCFTGTCPRLARRTRTTAFSLKGSTPNL